MNAAALAIVAEPTRREILRLVWDAERPAGEIASALPITAGAVSQHLRILREAGMVEMRKQGRNRYYKASKEGLGPLAPALEEFWRSALLRLKHYVEGEQA